MTSTNDGKDVKSNQTSGPKGKIYYIELYKSLEARLSGDCDLRGRTEHLCEAWRRIHSLCLHSAPLTLTHLLNWLEWHTAKTVLQTEWQSPKSKDEQTNLENAIKDFIKESAAATATRHGVSPAWERQLVERGEWFNGILSNPWGHPVLRILLDPRGAPPRDDEVLEWLKEDRGIMFVTRLRQLAASKCDDLAMSLASAIMDRVRGAAKPVADSELAEKSKDKPTDPTFEDILRAEAGFTADVWELLTDIEFVLLHKGDKRSQCIDLAKQTPLRNSHLLVERLQNRLTSSPREKKLWKNAKEVATLIAQVIIARCMVVPVCAGAARTALYCCTRLLARLVAPARLPAAAAALAAPAATAHHLHTLAAAVDAQSTEEMKPFVCELYVRAITAGMNELERLKLKTEKAPEARATEQTLSLWFTSLGKLLAGSERVKCECALTAFSMHPSADMFDEIKAAPSLPPVAVDVQEPKEQTTSDYGSWANDSRSQTNFVKTSETLKLKQSNHLTNVLSTAILTEGEALGLSAELCQDIAVLLAGPRVKTLSWDMDREVLLENCRIYMERTRGGTRALTTELKYLNLDPRHFQHLPEEEDDENDIYYGIEKGYEHLVEFQEPEEIWQNFLDDPEHTESACSSNMECTHTVLGQKKKSRKMINSDEDSDPLSLMAEAKKFEKKKDRPHSKERSKDRRKDLDTDDPLAIIESRRARRKEKKKARKERKKQENAAKVEVELPNSLSRLIGMKVSKIGDKSDTNTNFAMMSDSDYDSQGKISLSSLNLESNETDVLFDGLFSMDELKSPEKTLENLDLFKNNELCADKYYVAANKVSTTPPIDNNKFQNATNIISNVPMLAQNNSPYQHVSSSKQSLSPSLRMVTDEVKTSITRLLEFRRQKNDVINKDYSNSPVSQNNSPHNFTETQTSYIIDRKAIKSTIRPEIERKTPNAIVRPETMSKSQNAIVNPKISFQTQISPKVVTIPEIPKMYIDKKQAEPSSKSEYSMNNLRLQQNTCHNISPVIQYACKSNVNKSNDPTQCSSEIPINSIKIIENLRAQNDRVITPSHSQQNTKNDSPKQVHIDSPIQKPVNTEISSQNNFQNFLKELKESINAGTGIDLSAKSSKQSVIVKKEIKPVSRVTPVIPVINNKAEPKPTPQCAKQIVQQKKLESSLNTFSRLSYMHKNKQSDMKTKQGIETSERVRLPYPQYSSDYNRALADFKNARVKYLQSKNDLTVSRIEKTAPTATNNEDFKYLMKKSEKLSKKTSATMIPCSDTKYSTKKSEKQSAVKDYSVLTGLLHSNRSTTSNTTALRNTNLATSSQIPPVPEAHKLTSLSEKDHNDLLLLLRQQSKLNAPFTNIKKESVAKSSSLTRKSSVGISNKYNMSPVHVSKKQDKESQIKTPIRDGNVPVEKSIQNNAGAHHQSKPTKVIKKVQSNQYVDLQQKTLNKTEADNNLDRGNCKGHVLQSNTMSNTEKPTDWESVMNAILAQKTPSRGPNALDITLNKDSFAKAYADSLRNQRTIKNTVEESNTNRTISDKKEDVKTDHSTLSSVIHNSHKSNNIHLKETYNTKINTYAPGKANILKPPTNMVHKLHQSSTNLKSATKLNTTLQSFTSKVQNPEPNNQDNSKNITQVDLAKKLPSDVQQNQYTQKLPDVEDPFISGIPNSDYDLLEELMDDDLRQEIGELSSDEESFNSARQEPIKGNKTIEKRVSGILNTRKGTPTIEKIAAVMTPCINSLQSSLEAVKKPALQTPNIKCDNTNNSVYEGGIINVTNVKPVSMVNTKLLDVSSSPQSLHTSENMSLPLRNHNKPDFNVNNNFVTPNHVTTIDPPNVFVTALPQQTALQNVVLINSELLYDPYAIHAQMQTEVSRLTTNSYIINNAQNRALYTTTPFSTPVLNPLIIGNTIAMPVPTINSDLCAPTSVHSHNVKENMTPSTCTEATNHATMQNNCQNHANTNMEAKSDPVHQSLFNIDRKCGYTNMQIKSDILAGFRTDDNIGNNVVKDMKLDTNHTMVDAAQEDFIQNDFNINPATTTSDIINESVGSIIEMTVDSKMADESGYGFMASKKNQNINLKLEQTSCLDFNSNKNCEKKVLSQVQQKQDLLENIESKALDSAMNIEVQNNLERLKKKRMALINRKIYQHSENQPIPLTFTPLSSYTSDSIKCKETDQQQKADAKEIHVSGVNTTLDALLNTKIINSENLQKLNQENNTSPPLDSNENCKEKASNQKHCRRILMRSSNKLKRKSNTNGTQKHLVGRKTKVRLKNSELAFDVAENLGENNKNDKDLTNSERRASKRLLSKSTIKIKDNEDKITKGHCRKIEESENSDIITNTSGKPDEPPPIFLLTASDIIDFENELLGSKIPKIKTSNLITTSSDSLNIYNDHEIITLPNQIKSKCEDVQKISDDNTILNIFDKSQNLSSHRDVGKHLDSLDSSPKIIEKVNDFKHDTSKSSYDMLSHDETKNVETFSTHINEQHHSSKVNKTNEINSHCLSVKSIRNFNNSITKNFFEKKLFEEIDLTKPTVEKSHGIKTVQHIQQSSIGDQSQRQMIPEKIVCNLFSDKIENKNPNNTKNKFEINKEKSHRKLREISDNKEDTEISSKNTTQDSRKKSGIPQSFKDSIIIEPLPDLNNDDPHKQCVRIKLPTGRVFKATVHGQASVNFDTLFEDPAIKNVLLNSLTNKKRYTLNVRQVSTVSKNNPNAIISTKILPRELYNPNNIPSGDIETVNLLSDDEEECTSHVFQTEFGKYKIHSLNQDTFAKHQEKFQQKCYVKLKRNSFEPKSIARHASSTESIILSNLSCSENFQDILRSIDTVSDKSVYNIPLAEKIINPEIIEIDDSSNDSLNLNTEFENNSTKTLEPEDNIITLKNQLLQDLGVADITAASQHNTKSSLMKEKQDNSFLEPNELHQVNDCSSSKIDDDCFVASCRELARRQEHLKIINQSCSVRLVRCDDLVELHVKPHVAANLDLNSKKEVELDRYSKGSADQEFDDEISALSEPMSRRGSFSILNDFSVYHHYNDQTESNAIESVPDRSSPVMEAYEIIASLTNHSDLSEKILLHPTRLPAQTVSLISSCESDWFMTKHLLHLQNVIDRDIEKRRKIANTKSLPTMSTTNSTTCIDGHSLINVLPTTTFHAPNLMTLMLRFFQDDSLIYKLTPITKTNMHIAHSSTQNLKRKIPLSEELIVASKISKPPETVSTSFKHISRTPDHFKINNITTKEELNIEIKYTNKHCETTLDTEVSNETENIMTPVGCQPKQLPHTFHMKTTYDDTREESYKPEKVTGTGSQIENTYLICDPSEYIKNVKVKAIDNDLEPPAVSTELTEDNTVKFEPCSNNDSNELDNKSQKLNDFCETMNSKVCHVPTTPELTIGNEINSGNEYEPECNFIKNHSNENLNESNEQDLIGYTELDAKCLNKDHNLQSSDETDDETLSIGEKISKHLINITYPDPSTNNISTQISNIGIDCQTIFGDNNNTSVENIKTQCNTALVDSDSFMEVAVECTNKSEEDKLKRMCDLGPNDSLTHCEDNPLSKNEKFESVINDIEKDSNIATSENYGCSHKNISESVNVDNRSNIRFEGSCKNALGDGEFHIVCKHTNSVNHKDNESSPTKHSKTNTSNLGDSANLQKVDNIQITTEDKHSYAEESKTTTTGEKNLNQNNVISQNILDHQYTIPQYSEHLLHFQNMKETLCFGQCADNLDLAEQVEGKTICISEANVNEDNNYAIVLSDEEIIHYLDEEIVEIHNDDIIGDLGEIAVKKDCKINNLLGDQEAENLSRLHQNKDQTQVTNDSPDETNDKTNNIKLVNQMSPHKNIISNSEFFFKENKNDAVSSSTGLSVDNPLEKYLKLVGEEDAEFVFKGIGYEDPEEGTFFVFPFVDNSLISKKVVMQEISDDINSAGVSDSDDESFKLIVPKYTYSTKKNIVADLSDYKFKEKRCRKALKRKLDMTDVKLNEKKYRKGKNIDYPKITITAMADSAYTKEFRRLFDYCSSLKFSYSRSFHKEFIDVHEILKEWPIKVTYPNEPQNEVACYNTLFVDNQQMHPSLFDPMTQSLAEEMISKYSESEYSSSEIIETNFNMGFGERSGRVIQNLEDGDISKFSAATLSDVKQSQPFLLSENNNIFLNYQNDIPNSTEKDQIEKLKRSITYIHLKDKVRSFFKKTTFELNYDWIKEKKYPEGKQGHTNFPFGLNDPTFIEPCLTETVVQVVQVGQLPVSAAAQNPVTCDPRVTQVSNASPQCSEENSPHDPQSPMKTEYTELTTAHITLPSVQDYAQHDQIIDIHSQVATNLSMTDENIPIETEIKSEVKIELMEETSEEKEDLDECYENDDERSLTNNNIINNVEYSFDTSNTNTSSESDANVQIMFNATEKQVLSETFSEQKQSNGSFEKTDQIAHAMNAAGITTTTEMTDNGAHEMVNVLSQEIREDAVSTTQAATNSYSKTAPVNAVALQQALAQILPPPLNQTNLIENNQQNTPQHNSSLTSQVLHIVQGNNSSGSQITLVDNSQKSVINTPNTTPVLHIVQNKSAAGSGASNGTSTQPNSFSGLSLVDTGLQQGGNQLLHIVNTGNQTNNNSGQLLKRVNLLTNLSNVQGANEQKMVQFVCKSADGKIQLNSPHQRSMVLRLQPIESPNIQVTPPKPSDTQDINATSNINSVPSNETVTSQQEIKSRSVYEENYAKFIQNSSAKPSVPEKSTSLPKFNQAFGKQVFQDSSQKQNEINSNLPTVDNSTDNAECQQTENPINLEHINQISNPPLLLRNSPTQTTQGQSNLVQQIKQTIAPMNIQTMHGGVIYTRQIPVNIGGGQTINLITVPSTELIDDSTQKQQSDAKFGNQNDIEPSIIKIVPQSQPSATEMPKEDNTHTGVANETSHNPQPQPVLTQMRIKLPMLSKAPQVVSGTRLVRPSFLQIQRNVIGGVNQPVYQQLVLTTAPPLGAQSLRIPQTQPSRPIKVPTENQSSSESQMSSSTLEQLREFDLVLEQVKERSTVQPNSTNNNITFPKLHTPSTDTTDGTPVSSTVTEPTKHVLYSIGNNQPLNVAYMNRKAGLVSSSFVGSADSSGIVDSSTSSKHVKIPHTVTTEATPTVTPTQTKKAHRPKPRPKAASNPPSTLKFNNTPPKPSTQKPQEDEQTTQRILYILAEYKEQVENSPDKDKPAPRRRTNFPPNPSGSSKRKKSSSGSRRSGRDSSPLGEDGCRTMGSEDSSCGTSQGDCNESCLDSHSPQDSPRKVVRKLSFEQETPCNQPRPQPQRNVIVADGQTITVARGTSGKPATAVLMPANYILPVSMVKGGQQIAIVTNRGPKLLAVGGGEGGATGTLLLQRLIGPAGLKPVLARPGVRHIRLPTAALQNLQAFNLTPAATVQPPDSTASPAPACTPPDLVETRATSSPWADRVSQDVKPGRDSSAEDSEPWNLPSSADPHEFIYEETVRSENMDRTVLDPIPDRYSPDMEAQRIFDKMFDVDSKKSYIDSPRCGYDIDASDCDDKAYHQVVHKKDGSSHKNHRLTHVSSAALRHKYAILEHELRLQKSLSEECEDLGVDSPSASELFPEAELLFSASPAHDHTQDQANHSHTPQPTLVSHSSIPQPDIDDQIATDQLLPRVGLQDSQDLNLGLEDVGIVTVSEDGMQATIAVDQEEFARSHPNTTFHSEPTDEGEVQPFTITGLKGGHITSTIFHANRAPGTVLVTAPQATVISQATAETSGIQNTVKYSHIDNMINSLPGQHSNINLSSVLVKDAGLTRFDSILTDSRELHLSNTASAIVHSTGNATQVIRRVCYDEDKRDARYLIDEPEALIAGKDAKMVAEDSSRDATMESMPGDADDDRSSPERHTELFWESNSASERSESRRPLDFSSDSDKCCKSPSFDETNSTDSSGVGAHMRLDSVIKDARGIERSGSADGSSADDTQPPLRTYPPKRIYNPTQREMERSLSGKTRAGERSPDNLEVRRRASVRGVVKRGCQCCNGSPAPPRPKKSRQKKPTLDFTANN